LVAFEAILGLVLANAPYWFASPLGVRQVLSWGLLAGSLLLALHGFSLLRLHGAATGGIETTTVVVRRGVYRYIRHPLYLSLMLFALGAYLKSPGWLAGGLLGVAVAGLLITAYVEERENVSRFGESYREYMRSTKRFVPFVF
jgi:protein-S-isoprenylcysteine O-methyltransferase Ste14